MNIPELVLFLVQCLKGADPTIIATASPVEPNQILIVFTNGSSFRITIEETRIGR